MPIAFAIVLASRQAELHQSMNILTRNIATDLAPLGDAISEAVNREQLRAAIISACAKFEHAAALGDKEYLRTLHVQARILADTSLGERLHRLYTRRKCFFSDGCSINPNKIDPSVVLVTPNSVWEDVFKIVRGTWSMPYSKGYGRRLRFVIYDKHHNAVIGILGFQSPAADLACRDKLITVERSRKLDIVNSTLDVYTIGAVPPYSNLLGGKLVAGLAASADVVEAYKQAYGGKQSDMNGSKVDGSLIALTTASAFGRSSIYNRLRFYDTLLAKPIGFTKGFGAVHLEHLYGHMLRLLQEEGQAVTTGGFGVGPKIRWQNVTRALQVLNLPGSCLRHGLKREIFLFPLVNNLESAFGGERPGKSTAVQADEYAEYWRSRWALPRAERDRSWQEFSANAFFSTCFGT
ncbi:DUF4338 domain-containing protein [Azospirillum sp. TSA2s]|uniref:Druantia anti-phage system protein DruA n=1 Tax=Azospirillum sp. TSA2s TaxID=709810 RepID=UPI0010AA2689|nr:Druantia anti-phage system protein DruA [Azospirillum sp. TSA2s]QCG98713.1 DUF4338 domain-containing protein [Azospirillum sp. TSA2s]